MNRTSGIRVLVALSATLLVVTLFAVPSAALAADPVFTIRGGGNGHGIGMSQYGAQGYAINGRDYRWILAHYFQGTAVSEATTKNVKVRLDAAASTANAGYTRSLWSILPGSASTALSINGVAVTPGTFTFVGSGGNVIVSGPGMAATTYSGTVTVTAAGGSPALLQVVEGTGIYSLANGKYRGSLTLNAANGKMKLVNVLPLEQYCYGVVPREIPASWKTEALKAQAVAARSYAYPTTGELYCDTRSQAYQGYGGYNSKGVWVGEAAATNAAVNATANQVVKSGATVVTTYFFSASGGSTANIEDSWGYAAPKPYYTGVPDSYEAAAGSPYLSWELNKSGSEIGNALRASSTVGSELANHALPAVPASPASVVGVTIERGVSGYPRWVSFRFSNGATVKLTSYTVKVALGLKSPNFAISGFPMQRIQGPDRYATAVAVSRQAFSGKAPTVVLASGQDYPDALSGSALAGASKGSLLLSARTALPDSTRAELQRLAPAKVYIMGSSAALSAAVETAVKSALTTATVERVQGPNRYDTAVAAARKVAAIAPPGKVIVVSGTAWPDAASASALAYAKSYPVLLMRPTAVGDSATAFLAQYRPEMAIFVGGANTVSETIKAVVGKITGKPTTRVSGANRYDTAAAVARHSVTVEGFGATAAYLATGLNYADALTGGMLAGVRTQPLLLMQKDACPGGTAYFLREHRATLTQLWVFGSAAAISEKGMSSLDSVMMQ